MHGDYKTTQWQLLPQFLFVLLLSFGAYWAPWPLEGERPSQSVGPLSSEGMQTVDARLWQDPFAAVQRHREREKQLRAKQLGEGPASIEQLARLLRDRCGGKGEGCDVLGVMVFGGPYMGMEEFRRRTRYAVLAGLNTYGYLPDDPEHIGYAKPRKSGELQRPEAVVPIEWLKEKHTGQPQKSMEPYLPDMVVPFEWLTRKNTGQFLLLLWLDEDALMRRVWRTPHMLSSGGEGNVEVNILGRLNELLHPLDEGCGNCRLNLIGPASSGTLRQMVTEWREGQTQPEFLRKDGVKHWYAHSPTSGQVWTFAHGPPYQPIPIVRVTSTDAELIGRLPGAASGKSGTGLLEELRLRGCLEDGLVALVGQWDTAYSRNLIDLFQQGLGRDRVITAYYLRGLDGELPERESKEHEAQEKADREKAVRDRTRQVERPEGDAQTDYLRRLIPELKRREREAIDSGRNKVRAVGILGDDYHDKLLALKALQRAFPDAVFFTTDLDAAMLHPGDNRHTRNLVVASSFGLRLNARVHGPFPPFRDTYETGAYLATRIALHNASYEEDLLNPQRERRNPQIEPLGQQQIDAAIEPLVFEIGRRSAVRLNRQSTDAVLDEGGRENWHLAQHPYWQPEWPSRPRLLLGLGAVLVVTGASLLAAIFSSAFRGFCRRYAWALGAAMFLAATLASWLYLNLPAPLGEPFSWVEGISIWPTEILRLLTVVLIGILLLQSSRQLGRSDAEIRQEFFADTGEEKNVPSAERTGPRARDRWLLYQERRIGTPLLDLFRDGTLFFTAPHRTLKDRSIQWGHLALYSLLYVLVALGFMFLFGFPEVPGRGHNMMALDRILLILAVLGFVLLLFRVLDASHRTVWLAEGLKGPHTWPKSTLFAHGCSRKSDEKYFDDYLDVRVVAIASAGVQRMIYYPFLVFFMLVLSRSSIFDAWHVPPSLYLVFALALTLIVLGVGWLRRTAERVREGSLRRMEDQLLEVQGIGKEGEALEKQLKNMIEQVRTIRQGAFAPISQQPLVRAVLLVAGSLSGIAWLEAISDAAP